MSVESYYSCWSELEATWRSFCLSSLWQSTGNSISATTKQPLESTATMLRANTATTYPKSLSWNINMQSLANSQTTKVTMSSWMKESHELELCSVYANKRVHLTKHSTSPCPMVHWLKKCYVQLRRPSWDLWVWPTSTVSSIHLPSLDTHSCIEPFTRFLFPKWDLLQRRVRH